MSNIMSNTDTRNSSIYKNLDNSVSRPASGIISKGKGRDKLEAGQRTRGRKNSSKDDEVSATSKTLTNGNHNLNLMERVGIHTNGLNSRERNSPTDSISESRPSSRSHLNCFDNIDGFNDEHYPNTTRKSTITPISGKIAKKLTTKEKLFASIELSRLRNPLDRKNYALFGNVDKGQNKEFLNREIDTVTKTIKSNPTK